MLKRLLTAIVALPFLAYLIWMGSSIMFALFICLISTLALHEYYNIAFAGIASEETKLAKIIGHIFGTALILAMHQGMFGAAALIIGCNLYLTGVVSVFRYKEGSPAMDVMARQAMGMIYIPLFLAFFVLVRGAEDQAWIFLILGLVFAGDSAAFFVGSYLGKNKLCPNVSPKKTIEGSAGGIAGSILVGSAFKMLLFPEASWLKMLIFFLAINVSGQIGDLVESVFKRTSNIKDSGGLLPGHGGMLDRIDALLLAAPVAYLLKIYLF